MKKLSEEKLVKMEGGISLPSLNDTCQIYGSAFALSNGAVVGSLDFQMDAEAAYIACIIAYF